MALEAYSQEQSVEDMAGLMHHLGNNAAHVVGISMGSMTTLHFGLRHPEMARSLVICGTGPGDTARAKARFEAEIEDFTADIETRGWPRIAEDYGLTDDRLRLRDKNPAAYAGFQERLAMRAVNGPLQTLRHTVTRRPLLADLASPLGAMEVPTLIVTGDEGSCLHRHQPLAEEAAARRRPVALSPRPATPSIWKSRSSSIGPSMRSSARSRPVAGRRLPMRRGLRTDAEFHLRTDVGMSRNASCPCSSLFLVSAPPRPPDRKRLALPACPICPLRVVVSRNRHSLNGTIRVPSAWTLHASAWTGTGP